MASGWSASSGIGGIVARLAADGRRGLARAYPPAVTEPDAELLRPASQPTHGFAALRDVRIPVSDGLELSANLWLPEPRGDGTGPTTVPAILEMIPYRKDDWRAASDESRGEWLAARGFALCR